jgi:hypothetical protein
MATLDATGGPEKPAAPAAPAKDAPKLELTLAKDSVERDDKTSGLGRVFVAMDTNTLAADIANVVLDALRRAGVPDPWWIRVVDDAAVLRGADALALLTEQATALQNALEVAAPTPMPTPTDTFGTGSAPLATSSLAFGPFVAAGATLLQGVGALSALFAHDYRLSGREVPTNDLGFDLLVAQKLLGRHPGGLRIRVERLLPTDVTRSAIFTAITLLDADLRARLVPRVSEAAAAAAETKANATALATELAALGTQVLELVKKLGTAPDSVSQELIRTRKEISDRTGALAAAASADATAQAEYDALHGLATEIAGFLDAVTTPPPGGGRAPLIDAARAEARDDRELLLYVRPLAGGMDEIVDTRAVRSDTWTALAGATAEFGLVARDGTLIAGGTRSVLYATHVPLAHPDKSERFAIDHASVPDFRP